MWSNWRSPPLTMLLFPVPFPPPIFFVRRNTATGSSLPCCMSQCWKRPNIRPANPSWTRRFPTLSAAIRAQTPDGNPQVLYRAVHDAVIETAEYDYALSNYRHREQRRADGPEYTAYGALVEGSTVCFTAMPPPSSSCATGWISLLVCGRHQRSIGHQWNIVRLDGEITLSTAPGTTPPAPTTIFSCPRRFSRLPDRRDTSFYGWTFRLIHASTRPLLRGSGCLLFVLSGRHMQTSPLRSRFPAVPAPLCAACPPLLWPGYQ